MILSSWRDSVRALLSGPEEIIGTRSTWRRRLTKRVRRILGRFDVWLGGRDPRDDLVNEVRQLRQIGERMQRRWENDGLPLRVETGEAMAKLAKRWDTQLPTAQDANAKEDRRESVSRRDTEAVGPQR